MCGQRQKCLELAFILLHTPFGSSCICQAWATSAGQFRGSQAAPRRRLQGGRRQWGWHRCLATRRSLFTPISCLALHLLQQACVEEAFRARVASTQTWRRWSRRAASVHEQKMLCAPAPKCSCSGRRVVPAMHRCTVTAKCHAAGRLALAAAALAMDAGTFV